MDMDNITEKLGDEIIRHLEDLTYLDTGSDSSHTVVEELAQLCKLRIDEEKLALEKSKALSEISDKKKRFGIDRERLIIDIGMGSAELILPLALYGVLTYIGFAREFDGVITSDTLKRVLNNIRSKK